MIRNGSVPFDFAVLQNRINYVTNGQGFIWRVIDGLAPANGHTNFEFRGGISPSVSNDCAAEAILALLGRFEALRTTFYTDAAGIKYQKVRSVGSLPIQIYSLLPDRDELWELRCLPFAGTDLPIRMRIFETSSSRLASIVVSHMAIDGWGWSYLSEEFSKALGSSMHKPGQPSSDWQPIDQRLWENSLPGRLSEEKSVDYWHSTLAAFPPSLIHGAKTYPDEEGWWRVKITSSSLPRYIVDIAKRYKASPTTVIQTAIAVMVGAWFGRPEFSTLLISSNRFRPELRCAVGAYSRSVPACLFANADTVGELIRKNYKTALRAYQHGSISQERIRGIIERLCVDGRVMHLDSLVNVYARVEAGNYDLVDSEDFRVEDEWFRHEEITSVSFECNTLDVLIMQAWAKVIPKTNIKMMLSVYFYLLRSWARGEESPLPSSIKSMIPYAGDGGAVL